MSKVEKPYVLVVDDNLETCTLLTAILHREFSVEIAHDGSEAVDRLRTRRYGAVLLDLRMPQYDGFMVLDFLQQSQPDVLPGVVVVTASLTERELSRARGYNICTVITKPFDVDVLLNTVKECAGEGDGRSTGGVFFAPVILLLADLLRQRLM